MKKELFLSELAADDFQFLPDDLWRVLDTYVNLMPTKSDINFKMEGNTCGEMKSALV